MNAYREHQQHMEAARWEVANRKRLLLAFALGLIVGAIVLLASPVTGWTCQLAIPAGVVTFGAVMWMEMR